MKNAEKAMRQAIIEQCLFMNGTGLNQGTSGNIVAHIKTRTAAPTRQTPTGQSPSGSISMIAALLTRNTPCFSR